jgi:glutathione S-transferase
MKLYYERGTSFLAIRIVLNEIGVDAEYKAVNPGETFGLAFKGRVPALEISDGIILTEVPVILQYLAEEHNMRNLLPTFGVIGRYEVLMWLSFISSEIGSRFHQLQNPQSPSTILIPEILSQFEVCDKQLSDSLFLCGDIFKLPDSLLFVMVFWAKNNRIDLSKFPHLLTYYKRLKTRPSVAKSLDQEGLLSLA